MLSQKCKYAIRAVIYIATQDSLGKLVKGSEVAIALDTPTAFTVKILQELVKKEIIQSSKGPHGGFYLNEESKKLPIIEIIRAIDELDFFTKCGIGLSHCSDESPCPFHDTFKIIRSKLSMTFRTKTIGDFCGECPSDLFFLKT